MQKGGIPLDGDDVHSTLSGALGMLIRRVFFCGWGVGFCYVCVSLGTKKIKLCEVAQKSISPTKSNIESATGSGVRQDVWKEIEGQVEEDTLFIDWSTNPTDVPPPEIRPYDQGLLTIGFQ